MDLGAALAALARGEVIVFPTETVYGLGADALNLKAVEKVFELKGRDPNLPIPVLVADVSMLRSLVVEVSPLARQLMDNFWPGPLTLVLPARAGAPPWLLNNTGGIGVRVSSHPIATELVKRLGRALTATSANPSDRPAASTLRQARDYFAGLIDIFIDGGELQSRTGSTVLELIENRLKFIREGEIKRQDVAAVIGPGHF